MTYLVLGGASWAWRAYCSFDERWPIRSYVPAPCPSWVLADIVKHEQPRYVFCLNWSAILPVGLIMQTEFVNFHCAALPYGRGGAPIENLILRGHTETVITAHRMIEEVDAGPVYGTRGPVSLGPVRYIAKPGAWFMADSEARLIDDYRPAMHSGLFEGVRRCEKPYAEQHMRGAVYADEEVCGFDEFEIRPSCTKTQILDRFVDPVVDLIRWIVAEEPEPYPQVGPVVHFKRLDKATYEAFWKARAAEKDNKTA